MAQPFYDMAVLFYGLISGLNDDHLVAYGAVHDGRGCAAHTMGRSKLSP